MSESNDRIELVKFPTPTGEGYRAGDTYYLYLTRQVSYKYVTEILRKTLGLPPTPLLHDQTSSFRAWANKNNIPVPKDTDKLYNYVVTVGDAEIPTVWPSRSYMRSHRSLSPRTMRNYVPNIVYPSGTATMCRFGHMKPTSKYGRRNACGKCRWWREQGVDLSGYTPTHCLVGHSLKDNRWLSVRGDRDHRVTEHCVKCNNDKVMRERGYTPHD